MSRALEFIEFLISGSETEKHFINLANYDNRLMLLKIKEKMQRLESIDNANPSEALERIKSKIIIETEIKVNKEIGVVNPYYTDYLIIKQALLKAQEQDKVLEIIFKKTVGIFQLSCCKNVYEYNDLKFNDNEKLTQEEFELLKRWLRND